MRPTGITRRTGVVVIGAGQAGLSAAYHLQRLGFAPAVGFPSGAAPASDVGTYVVLDANRAPGGAWQHRWPSLTMETVNGIFGLPGFPQVPVDPDESSAVAVPRYFAAYEREYGLAILRPCAVRAVRRVDDDPRGWLSVEASCGDWHTRAIVNATGTWTNPVLPVLPGSDLFTGRVLHTSDYVAASEFAGQRVGIVGAGISALQLLSAISQVAETFWYTRHEPVFNEGAFDRETIGREIVAKVAADVEAGRPSASIVSYTGLFWTPYARDAEARGVLIRRPMFTAIEADGVREADGSFTPLDVILWATGFRPAIDHLDPLALRGPEGGIAVHGTTVDADPRIQLVGFGPSQSTVGANRAGRQAAAAVRRRLVS